MTRPLWQLSACEMREGLRARRFLATEIIESVAGRISNRNGHINAIVDDYTDQALREAEGADERPEFVSKVAALVPDLSGHRIDFVGAGDHAACDQRGGEE